MAIAIPPLILACAASESTAAWSPNCLSAREIVRRFDNCPPAGDHPRVQPLRLSAYGAATVSFERLTTLAPADQAGVLAVSSRIVVPERTCLNFVASPVTLPTTFTGLYGLISFLLRLLGVGPKKMQNALPGGQ